MVHDMPWKAHGQLFIFAPQAVCGSFGWGSEGQLWIRRQCDTMRGSGAAHTSVPMGSGPGPPLTATEVARCVEVALKRSVHARVLTSTVGCAERGQ